MSKVEATTVNGSGPTGDTGEEPVPKTKDVEEKKNVEEKLDVEENKDAEKKEDDVEDNGVKIAGNEEEGKEEKENEDVSMTEVEELKVKDGNDVKEGEEGETEKIEEEIDVREDKGGVDAEDMIGVKKEVNGSTKKRGRKKKDSKDGEVKEEKGAVKKEKKVKEEKGAAKKEKKKLFSSPKTSSIERPVRERKTVERLVEVIEKGPARHFKVEKGNGTPLKDIPNVAYKLARKRPADLKLLHRTLFGKRGKVINFKNHILQFSGFVWHENEEKQRARIKEKLDKYVKDTLLDLCDLFDIPAVKATTKKEDLVVKLLDFMAAPHVTTDFVLAEKEQQSTKSGKRKRVATGSNSKGPNRSTPVERSRKKRMKIEGTPKAKEKNVEGTEDENDDEEENGSSDEDVAHKHSDSDAEGSESEEVEEEEEIPDKGEKDIKNSSKQGGSYGKEEVKALISPKRASLSPITKCPPKISSSKPSKAEDSSAVGTKVISKKKRDVDLSKKKTLSKSNLKEKPTGKRGAKLKANLEQPRDSGPSQKALRKKICEILREVDFNTATFTDILKQLATHYKADLTPRKKAIKLMIQEELTKLADEAEGNGDDEADGSA